MLPLNVRSVGGRAVSEPWQEAPRQKWFTQLFWLAQGKLEFRQEGGWILAKEGEISIYRPGDTHAIRAWKGTRYFWITFDHQDAPHWLDGFGMTQSPSAAGPCPERLFRRIAKELANGTQESERKAAHLAHLLLLSASAHTPKPENSSLAAHAREVLNQRFTDPVFGVSEMVETLGVHRSTVFRAFRSHYGLTPSRYLQNLRRQRALALLQGTSLPMSEVARKSGFHDPNYFSRSIREALGMSPREIRSS